MFFPGFDKLSAPKNTNASFFRVVGSMKYEKIIIFHSNITRKCYISVFYHCTVKPVYNDQPRDPKFLTIVDRWPLSKGNFLI